MNLSSFAEKESFLKPGFQVEMRAVIEVAITAAAKKETAVRRKWRENLRQHKDIS